MNLELIEYIEFVEGGGRGGGLGSSLPLGKRLGETKQAQTGLSYSICQENKSTENDDQAQRIEEGNGDGRVFRMGASRDKSKRRGKGTRELGNSCPPGRGVGQETICDFLRGVAPWLGLSVVFWVFGYSVLRLKFKLGLGV